jgi:hypothetical protein
MSAVIVASIAFVVVVGFLMYQQSSGHRDPGGSSSMATETNTPRTAGGIRVLPDRRVKRGPGDVIPLNQPDTNIINDTATKEADQPSGTRVDADHDDASDYTEVVNMMPRSKKLLRAETDDSIQSPFDCIRFCYREKGVKTAYYRAPRASRIATTNSSENDDQNVLTVVPGQKTSDLRHYCVCHTGVWRADPHGGSKLSIITSSR